jgi:hypothetical protein
MRNWLPGAIIGVALSVAALGGPMQIARAYDWLNGTIRFHDYITQGPQSTCQLGVGAHIITAANDWMTMQRQGFGGNFDFGAGCYLTGQTLVFGTKSPDGAGAFGNIYGAGPDLTELRSNGGFTLMRVQDMWGGRLGMLSLEGPGNTVGGSKGLVLSSWHQDLGTHSITLHNITASNFNTGVQFGDDPAYTAGPRGAAAEILVERMTVNSNAIGVRWTQYNTLDFVCLVCNASFNTQWAFHISEAHQVHFIGGGATGNRSMFCVCGVGQAIIESYREEPRTSGSPYSILQTGGSRLAVRNSIFDTGAPNLSATAWRVEGDRAFSIAEQSHFNGRIQFIPTRGALAIEQSSFTTTAPLTADSVEDANRRHHLTDNFRADNGHVFQGWFADNP